MRRRQKAGFLGPISSNRTKEGKEKEKRKSEEEGRSRREKSNGCTLSSYNGYFGDSFFAEKKLLDGKGPFGGNVFKIRLDMLLKTRKILLKPFNVQHLHEAT